jgi:hypothetical protein
VGQKDNEGWASSKDHLQADPSTFRGYGENIAKLRFDFQTDVTGAGMSLRGTGQDTSVSTGMYEPGQTCGDLADSNGAEMVAALQDLLTSLTAIPAAILTMADLFDGTVARGAAAIAQAEALSWAFATPGADKPAGVPSYIKGTIQGQMKKYAKDGGNAVGTDKLIESGLYSGASVAVYQAAGGGKRYVVRTPGGGYTEWGENADGVRTYLVTQSGNGPMVTTSYDKGKVMNVTKRYEPVNAPLPVVFEKDVVSVVDERQRVETYDKNGKLTATTTDHLVVTKYNDKTETHGYYTEENGKKTNESSVGRQPAAATPETWTELARKQAGDLTAKAKGL